MQPRPEPIVEKLVGGGTSFFFPADVLACDQLDKFTVVILKDGRRIELLDETLVTTRPGTNLVERLGTFARVQQRIGAKP